MVNTRATTNGPWQQQASRSPLRVSCLGRSAGLLITGQHLLPTTRSIAPDAHEKSCYVYDGAAAAAAAAACAGIYHQLRRALLISTRFQLTGWLVGWSRV